MSGRLEALPSRIVHHHSKQLQRIASAIANDADWFDPDSDLLLKDLGLVTLRLYAAAAQLLDTRCGIPRSALFPYEEPRATSPSSPASASSSASTRPWRS